MMTILGYLRQYTRWNGKPGLSLEDQRERVRQTAARVAQSRYKILFGTESPDADRHPLPRISWPVLEELAGTAESNVDRFILVIPTSDGVRLNWTFWTALERETSIYVCDRDPPWLGPDAITDEAQRLFDLHEKRTKAVRAGVKDAKARGDLLGASRPGAYRFTEEDRANGRRASLAKRRTTANSRFAAQLPEMKQRRENGETLDAIAKWLSQKAGKPVDRTTVYRILRKAGAADRPHRSGGHA